MAEIDERLADLRRATAVELDERIVEINASLKDHKIDMQTKQKLASELIHLANKKATGAV